MALVVGSGSPGPQSPTSTFPITVPYTPGTQVTLSTSPPPWPLPDDARPYIAAAGLKVLGQEQLAVHYHAHLDILASGAKVRVPGGIGMVIANGQESGISVVHTHDTSGIIHIESPTNSPYVLGQVFTQWGVSLATGTLGGLIDGNGNVLRVLVDGRAFEGDPATIVLKAHQEIALWYGPTTASPNVPHQYRFPPGD